MDVFNKLESDFSCYYLKQLGPFSAIQTSIVCFFKCFTDCNIY